MCAGVRGPLGWGEGVSLVGVGMVMDMGDWYIGRYASHRNEVSKIQEHK